MSISISIPSPLRIYAGKQDTVTVDAATVGQAMAQLTTQYPELKKHLYSEEGKLRSFVNVYLNDEDIRYLPEKDDTPVTAADALTIIPSIAGGHGSAPKLGLRDENSFRIQEAEGRCQH
jgi:adenylyltransferase/sulfurtransferase